MKGFRKFRNPFILWLLLGSEWCSKSKGYFLYPCSRKTFEDIRVLYRDMKDCINVYVQNIEMTI